MTGNPRQPFKEWKTEDLKEEYETLFNMIFRDTNPCYSNTDYVTMISIGRILQFRGIYPVPRTTTIIEWDSVPTRCPN